MDLWAADEMAIGQYLSRSLSAGSGSDMVRNARLQTRFVWLGGKIVQVGVACPQPWLRHSTYPLDPANPDYDYANFTPTDQVRMEAEQQVIIRSTGGPPFSGSDDSDCPPTAPTWSRGMS